MTPYERAQWLLLLHAHLVSQRAQAPHAFADQSSLKAINNFLWIAYWGDVDPLDTSDDDDDGFQRWVLALWPAPPMA